MNSVVKNAIPVGSTYAPGGEISGEFVDFAGERYYAIRNVDRMPQFFVSVISSGDHWLFVSSMGGLSAGRVSPETALFPYVTVDKIHENSPHTGVKTMLRVTCDDVVRHWDPFNREHDGRFNVSRHLYKNLLGSKLCFEEINHDLKLAFRYTWLTSDSYGFIRQCELENFGADSTEVEILDGLQNVLPAGTPRFTQTNSSNLVDAYKWSELDAESGLAFLTLYSGITDRAEPCESLRATTVYCLGLEGCQVLISSDQIRDFCRGRQVVQEELKRGVRASYLVNHKLTLPPATAEQWHIVAEVEQSQADVVALRQKLTDRDALLSEIEESVARGCDQLARIMASADAYQLTAEENVSTHHYANVLFNVLRGGIFDDQYFVPAADFGKTISGFNRAVFERNQSFLEGLPARVRFDELLRLVREHGDKQLERLAQEYLPITFGRRHGDPSRPWNLFAIKLKDEHGNPLLSYEGNWRDIFQNWEALAFSYPGFVENIIAKFVNASTMDGYNPYRITKEGIDWEVEEPDDPWSYIGYWGDHQIIYLQKLLELSGQFNPQGLRTMLRDPIFCYANVPYRIRDFEALMRDPKNTVDFDDALAEAIEERLVSIGADGKLVLGDDGQVYQVNLIEKLLVPLLSKLGNLVVDGGIWLNTQRPEWNDANNALVGQGLSMVTLYYMRRYVSFLQSLLADEQDDFDLSAEVSEWLSATVSALAELRPKLGGDCLSDSDRHTSVEQLGLAAAEFRKTVYKDATLSGMTAQAVAPVKEMLDHALAAIDHSIGNNRREDGLYHAYNLMGVDGDSVSVDTLYPMLEGQVAILSSGAIEPAEAAHIVESLFESDIFRPDQNSFMLYPDRKLPGFLHRNTLPADAVNDIPLVATMLEKGDRRIIEKDAEGKYRFNADFTNASSLNETLDEINGSYGDAVEAARKPLNDLYETVFRHKAFTGRSGTMFGFEGLGSIYWHMVSKLLLAVEEAFFAAVDQGADQAVCDRLGSLYYRVREGIGFNKTPQEYGAFPTDPYSHTPRHAGARQPGMTGQVKEEVLTRFAELGVRVSEGNVHFQPSLLRAQEFKNDSGDFCFLDVDREWQTINVPEDSLAFTWCQVPVIYTLDETNSPTVTLKLQDGSEQVLDSLELSHELCSDLFEHGGMIRQINVSMQSSMLLNI